MRVGHVLAHEIPVISKEHTSYSYTLILTLTIGFMAVGFAAFYVLMRNASFLDYITALNYRATYFRGRGAYYYLMLFVPVAYLLFRSHSIQLKHRTDGFTTVALFLFALFATICTGSRANVFIIVMAAMIVRHYLLSRIRLRIFLVIGIALLVFSVIGEYARMRGSDFRTKITEGIRKETADLNPIGGVIHLAGRQFFPHEEFMVVIDRMPERLDFQMGKLYAAIPLQFIPDSIVGPNNHLRMGRVFTSTFFPGIERTGLVTLSPGILGEGYMNFHVFGVVANMFVFGLMARLSYAYLAANSRSTQRVLIYSISLPVMLRVVKGGFSAGIPLFIAFAFPALLGILILDVGGLSLCRYEMPMSRAAQR